MKAARALTCIATIALLRACAFGPPTSRADAPVRRGIVVVDAGAPRAVPAPQWADAAPLDPSSDASVRAIAAIEGSHARHFEIEVFDGERWVPAPATDCFRVARREDRSLRFELGLAFDNGHSCLVEDGAVVPLAIDRFRLELGGCSILLRRDGGEFVFEAEHPSSCATRAVCGARGRIEGSRISGERVETCDRP